MKFKKLLAAALSVLIAGSQCVVPMENSGGLIPTASAATSSEEKSGTFGAEGDNLTWVLDSEGTLTISGKGAMDVWNHPIYIPWYSYRALCGCFPSLACSSSSGSCSNCR